MVADTETDVWGLHVRGREQKLNFNNVLNETDGAHDQSWVGNFIVELIRRRDYFVAEVASTARSGTTLRNAVRRADGRFYRRAQRLYTLGHAHRPTSTVIDRRHESAQIV